MDKEALLMGHPDQHLDVILVPPDREDPWRRSSLGHVEALGEMLAAIRTVQDEALRGRDSQALAELTRLAGHARSLSEGLQAPFA
jgi:hypothetical protein